LIAFEPSFRSVEIFDLSDLTDELRQELSAESIKHGFVNLARAIIGSDEQEEVMAAAELDLLDMGFSPGAASVGISAGVIAYKFTSILRGISQMALQPEVEDEQ
jgi:hypothetical protein